MALTVRDDRLGGLAVSRLHVICIDVQLYMSVVWKRPVT